MTALRPGVLLDRDGVINEVHIVAGTPRPPQSLAALTILPGVPESLARLHSFGFTTCVVTNQPDVARGAQTRNVVEGLHSALESTLSLDAIYTCYHQDSDACSCRKPKPGLLIRAARDHGIDLSSSYMIGDRWRDIEAGATAGCRTIWIDRHYSERQPTNPDFTVASLPEAVNLILNAKIRTSYPNPGSTCPL